MKKIISSVTLVAIFGTFFAGCATKNNEMYYSAIQKQNQTYMESYSTVKNETVNFDGTFNGKITIIKPKKLPQLARIQKPKSNSELALQWAQVILPATTAISGMYFNYKSIDSSNKYDSETMVGMSKAQSDMVTTVSNNNGDVMKSISADSTTNVGNYTSNFHNDTSNTSVTDTTTTTTTTDSNSSN